MRRCIFLFLRLQMFRIAEFLNIIFVSSFHLEQIAVWITAIRFNATTQILIRSPIDRLHLLQIVSCSIILHTRPSLNYIGKVLEEYRPLFPSGDAPVQSSLTKHKKHKYSGAGVPNTTFGFLMVGEIAVILLKTIQNP